MNSFLTTATTIVVHTPAWVWALYALLLFLGWQRTRDSILPVWRLLILPLAVVVLTTTSAIVAGVDALPVMGAGLVIGGTLGWRLQRDGATRRLPDGRLWLRGEWLTFTQIVLVLIVRYATGVVPALAPALNADPAWHFGTLFVSSVLSAVFLGRTAAKLRVYVASAPRAA